MNVTTIKSNAAADVPIEQLAGNKALTQQQKVAEVARQFESILLKQILSETQKTVIPSEYTDDSTAAGIYQDMVTNQLADGISKSGTLGLAQTLERQLTSQIRPASTAGSDRTAEANTHLHSITDSVRLKFSQKLDASQAAGEDASDQYQRKPLLHPLSAASSKIAKPF
jgi:Rod binding domain-containing protein